MIGHECWIAGNGLALPLHIGELPSILPHRVLIPVRIAFLDCVDLAGPIIGRGRNLNRLISSQTAQNVMSEERPAQAAARKTT